MKCYNNSTISITNQTKKKGRHSKFMISEFLYYLLWLLWRVKWHEEYIVKPLFQRELLNIDILTHEACQWRLSQFEWCTKGKKEETFNLAVQAFSMFDCRWFTLISGYTNSSFPGFGLPGAKQQGKLLPKQSQEVVESKTGHSLTEVYHF